MKLETILTLPPERLVPQRPPILMVDGVLSVEGHTVTSHYTVPRAGLFIEQGLMLEAGLIENMAQTAALRSGVVALMAAPDGAPPKPPIGFIGAIKDFGLTRRPEVGAFLNTSVSVANDMGKFLVVRASATDAQGELARCEMTIFVQEA